MFTRSPFPGMDPWLEAAWESIHVRLIVSICNQIGAGLPAGLFAEVETSVYVLDAGAERGRPKPDVMVVRSPDATSGGGGVRTASAARPYLITIAAEPVRQRHVVIRSLETDRPLVTSVELLSPTNKRKRLARQAYLAKRAAYRAAGASVVEIDLVRVGGHLIDVPPDDIPADLVAPYKACVHRGASDDGDDGVETTLIKAEYYPMPLRQPLPTIAVPLRPTNGDFTLDVQRSVDEVYATGQYALKLDYDRPPAPPLPPADAAWAADRVAAARAGGV